MNKTTNSAGTLYIVATPIGCPEDITLRALKILTQVELIAAEDTRVTGSLLHYHQIKTRMISCHEHNEEQRIPDLLNKLQQGALLAMVSDAGTPTISDPGYRLVTAAVNAGIKVCPVPGASAATAALSAAGLATDAFYFFGFPAQKTGKRIRQLQSLCEIPATIIFYQSAKKIIKFLQEILTNMGDRHAVLTREMTKKHEEFIRGSLTQIIEQLQNKKAVKGECTLLLSGNKPL